MSATISRNIDEMPTGRAMDNLIARFAGLPIGAECDGETMCAPDEASWYCSSCGAIGSWGETKHLVESPYYSKDDALALALLKSDKLAELGFVYIKLFYDSVVWCCELNGDRKVLGQADTSDPSLSLAVCRAILKAIDAD